MFVILYFDLGVNLNSSPAEPVITSVTLAPFFPLHVFQEHWRFLQFIIPQHCWYCEGFFSVLGVFFPPNKVTYFRLDKHCSLLFQMWLDGENTDTVPSHHTYPGT